MTKLLLELGWRHVAKRRVQPLLIIHINALVIGGDALAMKLCADTAVAITRPIKSDAYAVGYPGLVETGSPAGGSE